jgi:hypothetical protein
MHQSYRLRLACPLGDFFQWTVEERLALDLPDVYRRRWNFMCPHHGPQNERPFQAEEKRVVMSSVRRRFIVRDGTSLSKYGIC